ncbi:MAG: carboxymuconolactone decarboxylase family protein [Rhodobacteraceae bacterium]|nr:carboxymuconolactone decarboxylase family protein [Paracoccaceae bacterium]
MPEITRYDPLSDADWPAEIADMRDGFAGGLNVYRTMAHHPALLRAWADLREHVVNRSALGRDLLEVVILRTGFRLGSAYEWSQHIQRARKYGLTDARILSLRGPVDGMTAEDALLAGAVDELFVNARLAAEISAAIVARFGKEALFDLIATVGFYSTLGFILNSFDTPLDDDIAAELAANPLTE